MIQIRLENIEEDTDENTTLDELLSTINQTENKASNTGISNDPGISKIPKFKIIQK